MVKTKYFLQFNSVVKLLIVLFFIGQIPITKAAVGVNISITQPEHHLAKITLTFEKSKKNKTDFHLPSWRTGRYEILNIANGIRHFSAKSDQGKKLSWHKIDKDTWQVDNTAHKKIQISYQVYANQLAQRTRHIDDSHAYLDASSVVMYSDESRAQQHFINLNVPSKWRSVSGLISGPNSDEFIAKNYDVLVDSPIETGINEQHKFEVEHRDYELVIWGKGNYDSAKMVADLKVLVQQSKLIWSEYPFERYVFMVHATSGARGATEHVNSTIIQRSRFKFSTRKDYLGFISTAAHEFVHTWNVKQYRPKGMAPYDYQQENYSNLLWLVEGSTSYFQNMLLLSGDLMSSKEFLASLAKRITNFTHKSGRTSQTVAQASFDNWLDESGDYGNNHSVNIYSEGFLVSWLLDFSIIETTELTKSYRDVHQLLYQNFKLPNTYDEADVLTILKQITNKNYQPWWQDNVHDFTTFDFNQLLAKVGLTMQYGKVLSSADDVEYQTWTGINTKKVSQGLKVIAVEKDSPAWQAGFTLDDIIVAVDDLRMIDEDLKTRLKNFKVKQDVKFTFFRRDELMTKKIALGSIPKSKLTIVPLDNVSEQQKAFFKVWTGINFPKNKKQ
ncbi:MAG: PDZ domain-containing protein [Colwellia sp.]